MESYSPQLDHLLTCLNGKASVSVVLILYLSAIAPYMSSRVVDCGSDNTIESFTVHPPPMYRTSGALYCLGCFKFRP
jgi:hypothetical protein